MVMPIVAMLCATACEKQKDAPGDETTKTAAATPTTAAPTTAAGDTTSTTTASQKDPKYPKKTFDQHPYVAEHHRLSLHWTGDPTQLEVCPTPSRGGDCAPKGPKVERGDRLEFSKSKSEVTPRVLVAKEDATLHFGSEKVAVPKGEEVALYIYQGEGTCALAVGERFAEGVSCPMRESFSGLKEGATKTVEAMEPAELDWWIQLDEGWALVDPERTRVEQKSTIGD
jgi:hypothetical protein